MTKMATFCSKNAALSKNLTKPEISTLLKIVTQKLTESSNENSEIGLISFVKKFIVKIQKTLIHLSFFKVLILDTIPNQPNAKTAKDRQQNFAKS